MKIKDDVYDVLRYSMVEENTLTLPPKQLERKLYQDVNKVLESIGGEWNKKKKCHVFKEDIKESFENLIETGEWEKPEDMKKKFQFFPTPKEVVDKMIDMAYLFEGNSVLEPSAGDGAIVFNLPQKGLDIHCVELNKECVDKLNKKINEKGDMKIAVLVQPNQYKVKEMDFMEYKSERRYDRIIMNPPFCKNQDIKHTLKAFEYLRPAGILVSILGGGAFTNSRKINDEFRQFCEENVVETVDLESGTFKESGTMVNSKIIKARKR